MIFWKIRNCFCAVRRRHSPSGRSTMADSLHARVYLAGVPAVALAKAGGGDRNRTGVRNSFDKRQLRA